MTMPELMEGQESERPDLGRLLGIVRRRHMYFLVPFFAGWLLVWTASWVMTPQYKSVTTVLVEQPTMPQNYVVPNISDDLQARLQSIKTQIESQTRLLMIINALHLYGGADSREPAEEKVAQMRKDIDIELVRDPQRQDISAFTVSYSASSPRIAQQVTGELTDLFINENNKVRQEESQSTTDFIEKQLNDARSSLAEQDTRVQQFESEHAGTLPTQQASNLQILNGLQQQLQNEQDALNTAKQQQVYYQAMLEEERANPTKVKATDANGAAAGGATDLAAIDDQLDKMRTELAELSTRYTDKYPDIISLKSQIARTEALRNSLAGQKQRNAAALPPGAPDPSLSAPARQIQSELQANTLEIKNRESAIGALNAKIADYAARLNQEPVTEQALADLNRGEEQSKQNYDDLLKKKNESEMATSMERDLQGERFTLLDPPTLPVKPDSPNRLKFCALGIAIGCVLGIAVVGGFEFMDDRLYSEQEIKAILTMPIISEVPEVVSTADKQETKKKALIGWATTGIVFVVILAGTAFSYIRS
jgi:polysaccharide biosynthesis transport protein